MKNQMQTAKAVSPEGAACAPWRPRQAPAGVVRVGERAAKGQGLSGEHIQLSLDGPGSAAGQEPGHWLSALMRPLCWAWLPGRVAAGCGGQSPVVTLRLAVVCSYI